MENENKIQRKFQIISPIFADNQNIRGWILIIFQDENAKRITEAELTSEN